MFKQILNQLKYEKKIKKKKQNQLIIIYKN